MTLTLTLDYGPEIQALFTDIPCYNNSPMAETIYLQLEL